MKLTLYNHDDDMDFTVATVLIVGDGYMLYIFIVIYGSANFGTREMPMCMVKSKSERSSLMQSKTFINVT